MKKLCISILLILLTGALAFSVNQPIPQQAEVENLLPCVVAERVTIPNGYRLTLNLREPEWMSVNDLNNEMDEELYTPFYEDGGAYLEDGYPVVPIAGRMFRLPPRSGVVVEVLNAEFETIENIDLAISLGGEELDYGYPENPVDEWFPGELVSVGEPAIFHNFRVTNLLTFPVQVNTARREARVYSRIDVEIRFEGEDGRNTLDHWPTHISEAMLPFYRMLADWDENELDEYTLYRGRVQVICTNTLRNAAEFQPWKEWKLQKGWELDFLTQDDAQGFNATSIRNELIARWGESEIKYDYVVVVGDNQGAYIVPPGGSQGDQPYSCVVGNDNLSDVGIGRISIQTAAQLTTYVNKVLAYERDPNLQNTSWYLRGVVTLTNNTDSVGKICLLRYFRHGLLNIGYTQVDTSWVGNGANAVAVARINAGVSVYSTRGYINTGLDQGTINALTNDFKTPVVCDVTCGTGNWTTGTGINEAYMLAGTANTPRGAIGAFGMATSATEPLFNNPMCAGVGWTLFGSRQPTMGDMSLGARVNLWNNFHGLGDEGRMNSFLDWFNLMGDPIAWVWTCIPQVMEVTASNAIQLGQNNYDVLVEDNGEPLVGAWVTLYKSDVHETIIARGVTDNQGRFSCDAPFRYTGTAKLTVTKQHYAPNRLTVNVNTPAARIGYTDIDFQDNGQNGTVGNNNGIPEAGETVGLIITAKNFGNAAQNDITASITSDDPWATDIEGTINYGTLAPNASSDGDGVILVAIAPQAQHDWLMHFDIEFETALDTYTDSFPIKVRAPQLALVSISGAGNFAPGNTANITIRVRNVGGSNASASTAVLESIDPFLGVPQPNCTFTAINVGQERTSSTLQVAAHPITIPGHVARAILITTTEDDQVDTTWISLIIGTKVATDPSGPDQYGYYAFDNTDTDYDLCPVYDWVEINPAAPGHHYNGTRLNINDGGEDMDQAATVVLPQGFRIQYYGEEFTRITVCSNGFLAMGSQADMVNARNWQIPSPDGPNYMIAPYWDELFITNPSGIYTYYDQPNGRYIVEWFQARTYNNMTSNTFEVIFYSQEAHPTYTGDTEFLFQYQDANHSAGGQAFNLPYWTTGIENGTQTDGIMIAYYSHYYPGAANIVDGRAILFSNNVALITGTIDGVVSDLETGEPIEGATVFTSDYVFNGVTNADGYYLVEEVIIGVHDLVVEAVGYNNGHAFAIEVFEDETTTVNFSLTHPEFNCDTQNIHMNIPTEDQFTSTINISNSGNGELEYSIKVLFVDPNEDLYAPPPAPQELDDPWDEYDSFMLSDTETRNRAVTFMGNSFWVAGSYNADPIYNRLYRYSRDGMLLGTYDQPVQNHSSAGFLDLTTDHEYLYGYDRGRIYKMAYTGHSVDLVQSWEGPVEMPLVRYLTYDLDNDLLWLGHPEDDIYGMDLSGMNAQVVHQYPQEINATGMGFYGDDPEGYTIHFICQNENGTYSIKKMDPDQGIIVEVITFDEQGLPVGADISNIFNPLVWTFMAVMDGGAHDYVQIWEIDLNTRWVSIVPQEAVIATDANQDVDITVFTVAMEPGEYNAWLQVNHNAIEQQYIIPLEIQVLGGYAPHFHPVDPTGRPYAIIVDEALFNGEDMVYPDEIAAYDGDICVGAEVVSGDWPLPVITWQSGQGQPGFTTGNPITIRVWSEENQFEAVANVTYAQGNGTFGFGPMSRITITATDNVMPTMTVPLQANYFELVSSYIVPENLNAAFVFGNIADLAIVYQDNGRIYIPNLINTIGNITITEGYQIFCHSASQWTVQGVYVDPTIDYHLLTQQWNWLGYPFDHQIPVIVALSPIADHIVIIQNDAGRFWIPGLVNTLVNMVPGTGYFIFVNAEVTFEYNPGGLMADRQDSEFLVMPEVDDAPTPTGLPYIVLVYLSDQLAGQNPSTVEIYDDELLVGKSLVLDDKEFTPVVTWGGSEEQNLPGFSNGHPIQAVIHSQEGKKIQTHILGGAPNFGEGGYASVTVAEMLLPSEFVVNHGYPNPFNPTVTVPFALPENGSVTFSVYNVLGQQIFEMTRVFDAGYHSFLFDANTVGRELVSGIYFLQVEYSGQVKTQKLALLK